MHMLFSGTTLHGLAQDRHAARASSWMVVGTAEAVACFAESDWVEPGNMGAVLTDDFADLLELLCPLR